MPASYKYQPLRQDIICAETAIDALPAAVDALGGSRALITCGPTILNACDVVPRVREALGGRYAGIYAGVAPHSPVETVEAGAACGAGSAAGHFDQRGRGEHARHHEGDGDAAGRGRGHSRLRDHI